MSLNYSLTNQPEYQSFFKSALALKGSVTPKVMKRVCLIVLYTSLVFYLCYFFPSAILPIGPFEYGGLVLGLVLVFRVNAGYDRWWEARKLWGNVVNQSRNLAIILVNCTSKESQDWIVKVTNMISALPYLMKDSLREHTNIQYLLHLIDMDSIQQLNKVKNRPLMLATMISRELQVARASHGLDSFAFHHAQTQIQHIIDAQGACERILKTPMPFVMAIKSRRFILFFLLMLPFALANVALFFSPLLIAGIVSYALFSLDQIGFELQNPFSENNLSHLPLDSICQTIGSNIKEIRDNRLFLDPLPKLSEFNEIYPIQRTLEPLFYKAGLD
ncbi:putative membrane protein [Legionella massiliensis]|uniref:Putative membrane protein n=1 Tax=Legionella massiliensis TaxID=1034943 RepID=A0A078KPQ1_9GAMM|nr:bestrophin family ion channel [Legionella massiliensis]CDZ76380.1 putative membrane protein [Legionella massiliensis]CEE12118.1 Bestrophin, RFP-TM, chloride channel [Legionella massiliensis]